jgi:hypothetical protein
MSKVEQEQVIEVPASQEKAYAVQGWIKYGMRASKDERFVKMRKEKQK